MSKKSFVEEKSSQKINSLSRTIVGQTELLVNQILSPKNFYSTEFLVGRKIFLAQWEFLSEKNFVKKYIGSKNLEKKNFGQKFVGKKKLVRVGVLTMNLVELNFGHSGIPLYLSIVWIKWAKGLFLLVFFVLFFSCNELACPTSKYPSIRIWIWFEIFDKENQTNP